MAALQKIPDRAGLEENLGRLYSEICGARPAAPSAGDKDRMAVKGLVVGHVQSGKTAKMAGLISMAADYR